MKKLVNGELFEMTPEEVAEYEEFQNIPVPEIPKTPKTIATAKLSINDGLVEGFAVDSAISGGFQIDTGKFLMFLSSPFEDSDYIVNAFDGGLFRCYVQTEDYYTDSFIITTTDLVGNPADPNCISIIVMKAV